MGINYFAVVAAALSNFLIGGLWYSPLLFHKPWMEANGFTEKALQKGNMARIFGLAFIFSIVMAFNLAAFLADPGTNLAWGATAGGLAGIGWVAMSIATVALFERRSAKYILINAGYFAVSFVVMGIILGAWR